MTLTEPAVLVKKKSTTARKGKGDRPLFSSIRKPLAPAGHPLGDSKPDERARPSLRKAKHKKRVVEKEE